MSERIRMTRDPISISPEHGATVEEDVLLYNTLKYIQQLGHSVIIVQRGYDGITSTISLKQFLAYWMSRGLGISLQTYQQAHNSRLIYDHPFRQHHMPWTNFSNPDRSGHLSQLYTAAELQRPSLAALGVHRYWHLLDCIAAGKANNDSRWFNNGRNVYDSRYMLA